MLVTSKRTQTKFRYFYCVFKNYLKQDKFQLSEYLMPPKFNFVRDGSFFYFYHLMDIFFFQVAGIYFHFLLVCFIAFRSELLYIRMCFAFKYFVLFKVFLVVRIMPRGLTLLYCHLLLAVADWIHSIQMYAWFLYQSVYL